MICRQSRELLEASIFSVRVRTAVKAVLCAFVICALLSFLSFDARSELVRSDVVRLHILADSNSLEDQNVKLTVKNEVQSMCRDIYPDGCTKDQAKAILERKLPEITAAAQRIVSEQGSGCTVTGELVNRYFPTRRYGTFTLPAGRYDALTLTIGSGEGHNWWCVMYPPVCISASQPNLSDTLTGPEEALITSGVEYKFKLYELYERALSHIRV